MPGTRFTSWLSEDERAALKKLARLNDVSENTIVRTAIRALVLDKPIPSWLQRENSENTRTSR